MISSFNLTKLYALLKDFHNLTQIRITVFNERFEELAAYPEKPARFCQLLRRDENALRQCQCCDREACSQASRRHSTYIYQCHAGLTEAISPIYVGNLLIGYLLFGHVFSYEEFDTGWEHIRSLCEAYQPDQEELKQACRELPSYTDHYIHSATHILQAVAAYLCLERIAVIKHQELPVQIDEYIHAHLTEDLNVRKLCARFDIGKTYLYEISKQNYGTGLAEHIRSLRVEKAKGLLIERPDFSISEVADACGFQDYNYFITVFKKVTGVPPKQFRQQETIRQP